MADIVFYGLIVMAIAVGVVLAISLFKMIVDITNGFFTVTSWLKPAAAALIMVFGITGAVLARQLDSHIGNEHSKIAVVTLPSGDVCEVPESECTVHSDRMTFELDGKQYDVPLNSVTFVK